MIDLHETFQKSNKMIKKTDTTMRYIPQMYRKHEFRHGIDVNLEYVEWIRRRCDKSTPPPLPQMHNVGGVHYIWNSICQRIFVVWSNTRHQFEMKFGVETEHTVRFTWKIQIKIDFLTRSGIQIKLKLSETRLINKF